MVAVYDPPYDSPIEDLFAYHFVKYASESAAIAPQVEVETLCGRFVLDFVLLGSDGTRIAVECDGKEFHDFARDEWRDAMILGERYVDAIYRLRGGDTVHNIDCALYVMSRLDQNLFSDRGLINLNTLAPRILRGAEIAQDASLIDFSERDDGDLARLWLYVRRSRVPNGERRFWQTAYRHALSVGGGKLDQVIQSYRSSAF
jgi:hypothetical protein